MSDVGSREEVEKFWKRFGKTLAGVPGGEKPVEEISFDPDVALTGFGAEGQFRYQAPASAPLRPLKNFVAVEGLDGSGKSSAARRFVDALRLRGEAALLTEEPHEESMNGAWIRSVLRHERTATPYMLALAFALNRIDHLIQIVLPACVSQAAVCDRYVMSSLVYQVADGISREIVADLNREAPMPQITFFLKASPETCWSRLAGRSGRQERFESPDQLRQANERYAQEVLLAKERGAAVHVIDAEAPLEQMVRDMLWAWDRRNQP